MCTRSLSFARLCRELFQVVKITRCCHGTEEAKAIQKLAEEALEEGDADLLLCSISIERCRKTHCVERKEIRKSLKAEGSERHHALDQLRLAAWAAPLRSGELDFREFIASWQRSEIWDICRDLQHMRVLTFMLLYVWYVLICVYPDQSSSVNISQKNTSLCIFAMSLCSGRISAEPAFREKSCCSNGLLRWRSSKSRCWGHESHCASRASRLQDK